MAANKKGEGSRGGHVIRHTKGGHAVYGGKATRSAAYALAGIASSASVGHVAGVLASKASELERNAWNFRRLAKTGSISLKKAAKVGGNAARRQRLGTFAVRNQMVQKFLEEAHSHARVAAAIVGTGLLYKAASTAIEGTEADTDRNKAISFAGAGITAALVTRVFENRNLAPLSVAVVHALKKVRKPISK